MHLPTSLRVCLLALLAFAAPLTSAARKPSNAVLLADVKSLTFRAGKETTHKRVSAIPQLKCVGGSAQYLYNPDTVRCTNAGASYGVSDIEWTCTASLPPEFKLGSTDVICEGYAGPEDDYILKGSCGLEYRLILTEAGEEKYGPIGGGEWRERGKGAVAPLFWMIFVGVVIWMIYSAFFKNRTNQPGPGNRGNGGGFFGGGGGGNGGGDGDDDNNDPPPPYHPHGKQDPYASFPNPNSQRGWRPGFWTGAATGAAASYMASGARQQPAPPPQRGGWFGRQDAREGPSGTRRSTTASASSSSGPSYSSTRYQSSGFGGTTRR